MGKTTSPDAASVLLQALTKSELLSEQRVREVQQQLEGGKSPAEVAKGLVGSAELTPWQARQLLRGYYQLQLGNYKLCELTEKTEWGRTFSAEHGKLGRHVSLTMLSSGGIERPEMVSAFLKDARAAARLDHRNLAHVYDVDQDGERLFVVTERIEGHSLQQLVTEGSPLSPLEAAGIVRQAAAGLEHAHAQDVIHADLHPGNLVVDSEGVLKIINIGFRGVAVEDAQGEGFVEAGERRNTAEGDVYSLGCLLHYALTGSPPESGKPFDSLPPELAKVCKAVMQDPERRPDAARVAIHLGKWLEKQVAKAGAAPVVAATPDTGKDDAPVVVVQASKDTAPVAVQDSDTVKVEVQPSVAAGAGNGISINTGAAGSGPQPQVSAAGGVPVQTAAPAAAPERADPGADDNRKLIWIIGGSVAALLLVVGGVVAAIMMSGDDNKQVAQPQPTEGSPATPTSTASDPTASDPTASDPTASDPASSDPASSDPASSDPASDPAAAPADPDPGDPKAGDPGFNPIDPQPADPDGASDPPGPATPSTPSPEPKPEVEPKPAPKPEPKPNPKPAPKKPKGEGKPPKPAGKPFASFPTAQSLPPVGGEPALLGSIRLDEKQLCFVKLRGGEKALPKSKAVFSVRPGDGGTALRDWDLFVDPAGNGSRTVIARLSHRAGKLSFAWADDADPALAAGLQNCLLSLSIAGEESHLCALRKPIKAEPMAVSLDATSSVKWSLEGLSDPSRLHLELVKIDGLDTYTIEPEGTLLVNKGKATIKVGESQALEVGLLTTLRGNSLEVKASTSMRVLGRRQAVTKKTMTNLVKAYEVGIQQGSVGLQVLQARKKQAGGQRNAGLDQQISLGQQDLEKRKAEFEQVKKLEAMAAQPLTFHFAVFCDAGISRIDVMTTGGQPPAPKAPQAQPARKGPARRKKK